MSKKRINIKPTSEVRQLEKKVDEWVKGSLSLETAKPEKELYRFTIDIPKSLHKRIKSICASEDISMRDKLTDILSEAFPDK